MTELEKSKVLLDAENVRRIEEYVPDDQTLLDLSDLFAALSDRTRIKILSALSITPMCVTDISLLLGLNQTTVSHQLKNLRSIGFVGFERQGKIVYYRIRDDRLEDILNSAATFMRG